MVALGAVERSLKRKSFLNGILKLETMRRKCSKGWIALTDGPKLSKKLREVGLAKVKVLELDLTYRDL